VPGVPLNAWLRAYDLEAPKSEDAPLPQGIEPVDADVGALHVHGFGAGPIDGGRDRWAIFVSGQAPAGLTVHFDSDRGTETLHVESSATLRSADHLLGKRWFILPVVGPKRGDVTRVRFDP